MGIADQTSPREFRGGIVCKGAYVLGSACDRCSRCEVEAERLGLGPLLLDQLRHIARGNVLPSIMLDKLIKDGTWVRDNSGAIELTHAGWVLRKYDVAHWPRRPEPAPPPIAPDDPGYFAPSPTAALAADFAEIPVDREALLEQMRRHPMIVPDPPGAAGIKHVHYCADILRDHQRRLSEDGVEVGVPRECLDVVLGFLAGVLHRKP